MKWNEVGERLFQLESDCAGELLSFRLGRWPVWQTVKSDLYFASMNQGKSPSGTIAAPGIGQRLRLLRQAPLDLLRWLSLSAGSRGPHPWAYTHGVDKQKLPAQATYRNLLCDAFVRHSKSEAWIYAEIPLEGAYRSPAELATNLPLGPVIALRKVVRLAGAYQGALRRLSQEFSAYLTRAFAIRRIPLSVTPDRIFSAISVFWSELWLHRWLFWFYPPTWVVTSEQVGTGMLAACIERRVPVLDLQHGLIDGFHPYYQYSGALSAYKDQMILPSLVGLFGEVHRAGLLHAGFWSERELVVVGSRRISEARNQTRGLASESRQVFFPTQWVLPKETRQLAYALVEQAVREGYLLILKPHPLETVEVVKEYWELAKLHPENVRVAESGSDLIAWIDSSRITVGFDSTVLLEAVALGCPVITVGTDSMPRGVHDLLQAPGLEAAVIDVPLFECGKLTGLISRAMNDQAFYDGWCQQALLQGERLFARDYEGRVDQVLQDLHQMSRGR